MDEYESILKDEFLEGIFDEGDGSGGKPKPAKVYPKLAGLINLGRTFFVSSNEIAQKNKLAQDKMLQKYGAEVYGSLIKCSYSPFMTVPDKTIKESGGWDTFDNNLDNLIDYLDEMVQKNKEDSDLKKSVDELKKTISRFDQTKGAREGDNKKTWKTIIDMLSKEPFQSDKGMQGILKKLNSGYQTWKKNGGRGKDYDPKTSSQGTDWNPNYSFRIDIKTSFDDNWFKKQFKSGFLNKAIMAIKTDAMSRATVGSMKDHKYTADEMLPQDQRKLDSIKWKMTNKVAKDYISLLLGWSRDKVINPDGSVQTELKEDSSFGKKMASKALDNRGILGRLKQKIFAGGQDSGQISVAFQLGDRNDGTWKNPKKDNGEEEQIQIKQNDDEVNLNPQENESTEPFDFDMNTPTLIIQESGNRFESDRYKLVKEVCEGVDDVSKLIDNCLIGYKYR